MQLTVALPIYNAKEIAWLCLESLSRQEKVDFDWELIVFEEIHDQMLGPTWFQLFSPIYGSKVKYITSDEKFVLGQKWHKIVQSAHPESKVIVFCAADNYYHPYTLRQSMDAIEAGFDWFYTYRAYFYDFNTGKIIKYDARRTTGPQMAASMEIAKRIPDEARKRCVNLWLYNNMKPRNRYRDESYWWRKSLFTNGYNTISTKRWEYFHNVRFPFRETDVTLEEILPEDIVARVKKITHDT